MTAPEQDHPDRWHLIADQIIAYDSRHIAMATNPERAREIVEMLNAQDAGAVAAETRFDQRLADLRGEFARQLAVQERRARQVEAEVERLRATLSACRDLADDWSQQVVAHNRACVAASARGDTTTRDQNEGQSRAYGACVAALCGVLASHEPAMQISISGGGEPIDVWEMGRQIDLADGSDSTGLSDEGGEQ